MQGERAAVARDEHGNPIENDRSLLGVGTYHKRTMWKKTLLTQMVF